LASTDFSFLQTTNPGWKERSLMETEEIRGTEQEVENEPLSEEAEKKLRILAKFMVEKYLEDVDNGTVKKLPENQ